MSYRFKKIKQLSLAVSYIAFLSTQSSYAIDSETLKAQEDQFDIFDVEERTLSEFNIKPKAPKKTQLGQKLAQADSDISIPDFSDLDKELFEDDLFVDSVNDFGDIPEEEPTKASKSKDAKEKAEDANSGDKKAETPADEEDKKASLEEQPVDDKGNILIDDEDFVFNSDKGESIEIEEEEEFKKILMEQSGVDENPEDAVDSLFSDMTEEEMIAPEGMMIQEEAAPQVMVEEKPEQKKEVAKTSNKSEKANNMLNKHLSNFLLSFADEDGEASSEATEIHDLESTLYGEASATEGDDSIITDEASPDITEFNPAPIFDEEQITDDDIDLDNMDAIADINLDELDKQTSEIMNGEETQAESDAKEVDELDLEEISDLDDSDIQEMKKFDNITNAKTDEEELDLDALDAKFEEQDKAKTESSKKDETPKDIEKAEKPADKVESTDTKVAESTKVKEKPKPEKLELSTEDQAYFDMLDKKRKSLPKEKQLPNSVIETIKGVAPSLAEKQEKFSKKPELKTIAISRDTGSTEPYEEDGVVKSNSGIDISMSENSTKDAEIKLNMEKGYRALLAGQTSAAVVLYSKVLELDSQNMDALFGLATAYHKNYQYEQARATYAKILRIEPNNKEVLNNFLVLVAEESPESALLELQKLERINSNFSPIPAQIAMIYLKLGQPETAERYLRRAVVLSPENITYKYNLAITSDKLNKHYQAISLYGQVLEAARNGAMIPGSVNSISSRMDYLEGKLSSMN